MPEPVLSRGPRPPARRAGRRVALALALVPGALAAQEVIEVPSGQPVTLYETITGEAETGGVAVRFRFLAPQIARDGGTMPFELAAGDIEFLCESYALPRLSDTGPELAQIVITLMDRPVPFGQADPEATQFFEAFRPEDGRCVWEGF
ncbi:DUF6497 family protein [Rhodovulum sp.]|uniref:DUF6497 family protein n=1 Tax=Rhodovulum sp. TaxID=34009 RepID=UPI00257EFBF3|nr:DUF6497 family protein [Rhodovulum sp.]